MLTKSANFSTEIVQTHICHFNIWYVTIGLFRQFFHSVSITGMFARFSKMFLSKDKFCEVLILKRVRQGALDVPLFSDYFA